MTLREQIHKLWSIKSDEARVEEIILILAELLCKIEQLEVKQDETT